MTRRKGSIVDVHKDKALTFKKEKNRKLKKKKKNRNKKRERIEAFL